jgi:cell filamentation protein
MSDRYLYPGTNILRNIENIQDAKELTAFERIGDSEQNGNQSASRQFGQKNSLRGIDAEDLAARAAEHAVELNAIKPFREGNGRTLRAFLFLLAWQAGHDIHMERIDPVRWNEASRVSFRTGDSRAMRNIIAGAMTTGDGIG